MCGKPNRVTSCCSKSGSVWMKAKGGFQHWWIGTLWFKGRLCVPQRSEVKDDIFWEVHRTPYTVCPGETKMYCDLKQNVWWKRMNVDIANYVASCEVCQHVKDEHKHPVGLLQPWEVPQWHWDDISMDYVVMLACSPWGEDVIWYWWIISASLHTLFLSTRRIQRASWLLFMCGSVWLHGVLKTIIPDKDVKFVSKF